MKKLIKKIKKIKKIKGQDILVISHESPDGDAISSIIGFSLLLKELGAKVLALNKDKVPSKYNFLEKTIKIKSLEDLTLEERYRSYSVYVLDSAKLERIGFSLEKEFPNTLELNNIDHHISNNFFGDNNYVYPDKGATSEIIGNIYLDVKGTISSEAATAIYTGIMTDTGNLTYESTKTSTVDLISILMKMGADFNQVKKEIYEKNSIRQLEGLKAILNNLKVSEDGLIAYTFLPFNVLEQYQISFGDIENYVDYPRSVETCEIAILFKEFKDEIRVSVRTKNYIDANKLASFFKGGGHKRASGFIIKENLEFAIDFVLARIKEGLKKDEWLN